MIEYKAPSYPDNYAYRFSLFLAGSIEMGLAEKWQDRVVSALSEFDIDIFNPRRDDWDSSWEQVKENKQFKEQVEWELDHIDIADHILFYFDPSTKSPVSMLELGIVLSTNGKSGVTVCCPSGFWRKGNVDIVCERYGVTVHNNLDSALEAMMEIIP